MKTSINRVTQPTGQLLTDQPAKLKTNGSATLKDNRPSTIPRQLLQQTMQTYSTSKAVLLQRKSKAVHKQAQPSPNAYSKSANMYLNPVQEKYTPYEMWNSEQQKQENTKPTLHLKRNLPVHKNDADVKEKKSLPTSDWSAQQRTSPGQFASMIPVFQLNTNDEKKDKEKLEQIYDLIANKRLPILKGYKKALENKIYNILGMEIESGYEIDDETDKELIKDPTFFSESLSGKTTREQRIKRNEEDFVDYGAYFFISNKNNEETPNERMIINVRKQKDAGELLKYIAKGWGNGDWRDLVKWAKFLGMNKDSKKRRNNNLKYDKVVIYYNNSEGAKEKIAEGVEGIVGEDKRVDDLSAFYNVLAPGIATQIERGGMSFTRRNAKTLINFILNQKKGFLRRIRLTKKEFVDEAYKMVMEEIARAQPTLK